MISARSVASRFVLPHLSLVSPMGAAVDVGRCGFASLSFEPTYLRVQANETEPAVNLAAHILRVEW